MTPESLKPLTPNPLPSPERSPGFAQAGEPLFAKGKIVHIDLVPVPRAYDIVIGDSILAEAGTLIDMRLGRRRCLVVTDSNVGPLYQQRCEAVLAAAGHALLPGVTVPAGEGSKDFATLQKLLEQILANGADRKALIIALGGGVVGDLAGLAASLALRGLDVVQIPTTLVAQTDSAVGGKTGIDTAHGKNTVGAFYQPRLVIADVSLLDSLPPREMLAGYAEVVKYGLIGDAAFFRWCKANAARLLNGDRPAQIHAVGVSCAAKAKIVAADEREAGRRALLNLGHTFGHALEAATGYGQILLHGEAVAIGMVMAFKLSAKLGLCPDADAYEMREHLVSLRLPIAPPPFAYDLERLMQLMAQDKKAEAGTLTLILAKGIGEAFVSRDVDADAVRAIWQDFLPKS
ncbi:MAG TPA: 3-dehydroquinate synthase [Alphaproteobacteria bacterium]|nr:3-dehydroquinate synthase [Alphaproteobacteria bacterium]